MTKQNSQEKANKILSISLHILNLPIYSYMAYQTQENKVKMHLTSNKNIQHINI